ncbi:M20/M25/M40 family metallo-hydrolase [Pontibacter sp. E15-1]|uniref:M28 family metallopeptidase n=1 Tax=Pontibacter sp. E15-1 TaxID=2919918 RepID=UPI001F4FD3D5|nr:M20/M25/M40 family metallo-hydrolase [Pontibacter sp. E15-1]MCJ8165639.1 M20/M25/M40 family metallo-hydrolase [Pontibacter sp. E15-1]
MKRLFPLLLLLCMAASTGMAQDMPRVRHTIDTLTSAAMHGRGYIYQGDAKAAGYIQNRFRQLVLQALSQDYFQPFRFPVNTIVETPQLKVAGCVLRPGQDFVANAASASGKGKTQVLPLDTAVFSDAAAARKFFSQNFKDKAIVYRQREQKRISQLPQPYQQQLQQAKLQVVLQPKALLTSVAQVQAPLPVLEVLESAWPTSPKNLTFAVQAQLMPQHEAQNVVGYIKGTAQPDSFLVFTAHYDHLGGQGKEVYFPGANDNASGTAMLLELAAYYSQPQHRPRYSIAFIAFAAEEAGLLGSTYYTTHPLFSLERIRFLVNLDLLGTGSEGMMVVNGKVHEAEFRLLQQLNEAQQYLSQLKARGKAANSDHYPFSEKGVPAFFFYTLGGTAAYHNTNDYATQLPLTKFENVFKLIVDFAERLQE